MAPFFGASTIVWANTIAIVLVALSIGYWFGGRMADRRPNLPALCATVLAASVLMALVPFVADPFLSLSVDAFDSYSVGAFAGSLFGVLVLVAVPVLMLGSVSPWALRLKMHAVEDSGQVAGRMYAISTVGSLLGTFARLAAADPARRHAADVPDVRADHRGGRGARPAAAVGARAARDRGADGGAGRHGQGVRRGRA